MKVYAGVHSRMRALGTLDGGALYNSRPKYNTTQATPLATPKTIPPITKVAMIAAILLTSLREREMNTPVHILAKANHSLWHVE